MKHLELASVGLHKGAPRVWIQGRKAEAGGFLPGTRYKAIVDPVNSLLTLEVASDGMRVVSRKVRNEREMPVLDLNSNEVVGIFSGLESVRVVVSKNRIHILPVASELRAKQRLESLCKSINANEPISIGSTASGIGLLDLAAHEGLALAGQEAHLAFANEIRDDCMEHAMERNPAFGPDTVTLTMPLQELVFDAWAMKQVPQTTILVGGLPCSGASLGGRTKRGLEHPESHPDVGHLVCHYIALAAHTNPAALILENVVPYRTSASMAILRSALRDLGYIVHEAELDASEWNLIEARKRFVMVAVTKGIDFSFDDIERPEPRVTTFGDIMEDVDPNHSTWGNIDYLWAKQERDSKAGKGFAPTVIDASSTRVPTQTKNLAKRQSTGTFIQHPTDPSLYRIPTLKEHSLFKGVWPGLVEGTTQTFGHEALGQGISLPPFVSVFKALGRALRAYALNRSTVEHPVFFGCETVAA